MTTVAAVQMCSSSDVEENLAAAAGLIASAARQGARLIVLPENFAVMGVDDDERCRQKEVFGAGKIQDFLSAQSQKYHVWIVGGTIPMACQDEAKVRAASLLFNEAGECVARYDKIHLFDVVISDHESYKESDGIQPGSKIVVAETPIGKIGMAVCYDIRFPELFRCMANAGAEILVLPSAFTVKTGEAHWEVLTRSRAIENFCYVIAAGQGGTHDNGRRTYGHSLIIHPWGRKLAELTGEGVGVICADLNPDELAEIRKSIPVAQHQRIFFNINGLNEK